MFQNDQWTRLLLGFVDEARDTASQAEALVLQLEQAPNDGQVVDELFRLMHTFKGTAGLFDLKPIVRFAHRIENVLAEVRHGQLRLDPRVMALMLGGLDEIVSMIELIDADTGELPVDDVHQAELLSAFDALTGVTEEPMGIVATGVAPVPADQQVTEPDRLWLISLRFDERAFIQGLDPQALVQALGRLGSIKQIDTLNDELPVLADMDPERCYLGLEIQLQSAASKPEIESLFDFVRPLCRFVVRLASDAPSIPASVDDASSQDTRIGHILLNSGALTAAQLAQGLAIQQRPAALKPSLGSVLVEEGLVPAQQVNDALDLQHQTRQRRAYEGSGVRVAAQKLDQLVDLVGELVTSAAGVKASIDRDDLAEGAEHLCTVSQHIASLRETALGLRMVEVGETFSRFHRVVRDVSEQLHKEIHLDIRGADTELDKLIIDRLADPLTHLVRNAIAHGIEPAQERGRGGKPVQGRVRLAARQESGVVIIEVSDDGRGLDWDKIRRRAVQLGLIDAHREVDQRELRSLIFSPGFSTASTVSELSGRGVGLDVVREVVTDLRGEIEVESVRGAGTLFRIRVPLTLAIINGFQFSVGTQHYVVPLETVLECQEWLGPTGQIHGSFARHGRSRPCIDLASLFDGRTASNGARRNALVVSYGSEVGALIADDLYGELQTVVKPLGPIFRNLPGISGATVLGSGEIALVLDVAHLFHNIAQYIEAGSPNPSAKITEPEHHAEE
ncbi:chemotaxis protein CheA [Stutzerimonas stutzeri]|uniref:Chemotaxis protein CheA n=1 Tax=Stutzerimonas stutzeri TaxID=316 RepID=W8R716_STUST|nr:chemotaxis protein CheA [Stutzerimonas stutzeri]AHL75373.1 chemotaxis protein CheA [Stutzerimonas stutzeri]MCQ4328071.1 chemotaxis protein CheA [Stutzerimonas stutzeri]